MATPKRPDAITANQPAYPPIKKSWTKKTNTGKQQLCQTKGLGLDVEFDGYTLESSGIKIDERPYAQIENCSGQNIKINFPPKNKIESRKDQRDKHGAEHKPPF